MEGAKFLIVLLALGGLNLVNGGALEPEVLLKNGLLGGKLLRSSEPSLKVFYGFLGIPYAKPPIGPLRFQRPEPAEPWDGTLDARQTRNVCPQIDFFTRKYMGDEDCLYLNVYSQQLPLAENPKFPVLVFIHGGAFIFGSGDAQLYNPKRLLDKDIVLVTFNYRLGVLGFLSTGDEVLPGNLGLFDQIMALKWIKENIYKFGGDPDRVTIFGESAGGASVSNLIASPHAEGLFHAAIMQSGTSLCDWSMSEEPKRWAKRLALKLHCPALDSAEFFECVVEKTPQQLLEAHKQLESMPNIPIIFAPVVEGTEDGFFPDHPRNVLESGKFNRVPVIVGINRDEGAFTYATFNRYFDQMHEEFWDLELSDILTLMTDMPENYKTVSRAVKEHYLGPTKNNKFKIQEAIVRLYSDIGFDVCTDATAKLLAAADVPTYLYKFSHEGQFSLSKLMGLKENLGVGHADEIFYLFENDLIPGVKTEKDLVVARLLVDLWTNFATYKNPTSEEAKMPFTWTRTGATETKFLEIDAKPKMVAEPLTPNIEFWTETIYNLQPVREFVPPVQEDGNSTNETEKSLKSEEAKPEMKKDEL